MTQNTTENLPATSAIPTEAGGVTVRVRYFAAARAAAGTEAETLELSAADGTPCTRADVETLLAQRHPQPVPGQPPLAQVLARSSFLLKGVACSDPAAEVPDGAVLDVLPPFSGG